MRHKLLTKMLVLVLALLVMIPNLGLGVFAADGDAAGETTETAATFDTMGSKTAGPTLLYGDERETSVTLSLPSAEYKNQIDVVMVIDSSSSTDLGSVFIDAATELFSNIVEKNPGVELKVGIVLFTGRGNDAIKFVAGKEGKNYEKLTVYDENSKDIIEKCFDIMNVYSMTKDQFRQTFGRGSGPHSGLDMADEWLAEDTDVDDSQKYVVLMTDGKGYIWNDDNNVPTTIYSQWYQWKQGVGAHNVANGGKVSLAQNMGYNKGAYALDVLDPVNHSNVVYYTSYEELYALTEEPELNGVNEWDQKCTYAIDTTTPSGTVVRHPTTNGIDIFGDLNYAYWYEWFPDEAWEGVKYLEMNPYVVIENDDETYTFDTEKINPYYYQYHFDCLQKGLYKAGHLWTDMGDKYNCAVVTYDSSGGGGLELVDPFKEWIRSHSLFSAQKSNAQQIADMFADIDNDIRYMVSKGVVTDEISDNFDLKNPDNANGFRMTYNGETLTASFADGVWSFDDGNYTVSYDAATKTITWNINVPVENLKPVTLSYDLLLTEESAKTSKVYPTNKSAVLDFKSTDGKKDGSFTFEVPEVAYIKLIDISVKKVWDDGADQDGLRPDKISVDLLVGEEVIETGELTQKTQWTYTFEDIPDSAPDEDEDGKMKVTPITYKLSEVKVEGYEKVEVTGNVTDGFVITNTHVPEVFDLNVTKIWDDEDDKDGIRPDSVTVYLVIDGEKVEEVFLTLDEENDWTGTFEGLIKYAAGEQIEYTVEEEPVEGYESSAVFVPEEGFEITNTHTITPPHTDDTTNQLFWAGMMISSLTLAVILIFLKRRQREE